MGIEGDNGGFLYLIGVWYFRKLDLFDYADSKENEQCV